MRFPWPGVVVLALCLSATQAGARASVEGEGRIVIEVGGAPITVYTYTPPGCAPRGLLFVLHGLRRNARAYRDKARGFARRACLVVQAPRFDKRRFPNWRYQRGGVVRKGHALTRSRWTSRVLAALIERARERVGGALYLFGHSAGAQFLSRVAAYDPPPGVTRFIIANPSTHVFPDLKVDAPYGFGGLFSELEARRRLRAYLALPLTIYLGGEDTGSRNLSTSAAAMRQGRNRRERGRRLFRAARALAREKGWRFGWRLVEAPGVGHSARRMLDAASAESAFGLASAASAAPRPAAAGGR